MYCHHCQTVGIKLNQGMDISAKFKGAIAFLACILFFVLVLISLYFALKRGLCNCVKPRPDEVESEILNPSASGERDKSVKLLIDVENPNLPSDGLRPSPDKRDSSSRTGSHVQTRPNENGETSADKSTEGSSKETREEVTKSSFVEVAPKKRKKNSFNSILKKIRRPRRASKVRFRENVTEETPLIQVPKEPPPAEQSTGNSSGRKKKRSIIKFGNDAPSEPPVPDSTSLQRSESLESFLSQSTNKTNSMSSMSLDDIEEFGNELSPSRLQILVQYFPEEWRLDLGVKQAQCLIITGTEKQKMYWQVHLTLLPFKRHRFKTRYKSSSAPIFNQTFEVRDVAQQALGQMAVRYRVYARTGRAGRKKLAGETEVKLDDLIRKPDHLIKDWRILKRRRLNYGGIDSPI